MGTFDFHLFASMVVSPLLLAATWTTLWVATVAQGIGIGIGLCIGPMLMARRRLVRGLAWTYSWFFRGTPLLAQILFFYAVLPQLDIRLDVVTTGLLALGLNEGARMGEIVRAGLGAVPKEQSEAAMALGLRRSRTFLLVVLPQAVRVMIPPIGNNYSYMIKATSLLSVIAFAELLRTSQLLAQSLSRPLEVYGAAAVWYLVLVSGWGVIQHAIERRLARGEGPSAAPKTPISAADGDAGPPALVVRSPAASTAPVVISARRLVKRLGTTYALAGVDLDVHRGEVLVVMGPSGSGKSTLLRALDWLEPPDEGSVAIEGTDIAFRRTLAGKRLPRRAAEVDRQRRRIGMVFQRFNLFPHMTAQDNVAFGLRRLEGVPAGLARAKATALLTRFGLADKAHAFPDSLSGGQRQRVAIARALAMDPVAVLFDEPTSALDPETVREVLDAMAELARSGTTMVVVTHEVGFARRVADRIIFMDRGRIVAEGAPDVLLDDPADPRLRAFLGRIAPPLPFGFQRDGVQATATVIPADPTVRRYR
jgi:polar amino acid transport system permease protein